MMMIEKICMAVMLLWPFKIRMAGQKALVMNIIWATVNISRYLRHMGSLVGTV